MCLVAAVAGVPAELGMRCDQGAAAPTEAALEGRQDGRDAPEGDSRTASITEAVAAALEGEGGFRAALVELADKGGQQAVAAVSAYLSHEDWAVRVRAVRALAWLTKGGQPAVEALAALLEDEVLSVQGAAAEALGQLTGESRQRAIALVQPQLMHGRWAVRLHAVQVLQQLAQRGDRQVVELLAARLEDEDWGVRRRAAEALGSVAAEGDTEAIAALSARLEDCIAPVRNAVTGALTQLRGAPKAPGASSGRSCGQCGLTFRGFGDTCGSCRRAGRRGSIQQCVSCSEFFQGSRAVCEDCT